MFVFVFNRDCENTNFAWRNECNRCHTARPEGAGGGGGGGGMFANTLYVALSFFVHITVTTIKSNCNCCFPMSCKNCHMYHRLLIMLGSQHFCQHLLCRS